MQNDRLLRRRDRTGYVDMAADPKGPRYIDFPTLMMRDDVLRDLVSQEDENRGGDEAINQGRAAHRAMISRAHRLLAEACLAQHTILARHADWMDDARHYRRLVQAVFHATDAWA